MATYRYQYLSTVDFHGAIQDLADLTVEPIASNNANEIGAAAQRMLFQIVLVGSKARAERNSLKRWVRSARGEVRNHGSISRYKGASANRARMNSSISDVADSVKDAIEIMEEYAQEHVREIQVIYKECLQYTTKEEIEAYESARQRLIQQRAAVKELRDRRVVAILSVVVLPLVMLFSIAGDENIQISELAFLTIIAIVWGTFVACWSSRIQQKINVIQTHKIPQELRPIEELKAIANRAPVLMGEAKQQLSRFKR